MISNVESHGIISLHVMYYWAPGTLLQIDSLCENNRNIRRGETYLLCVAAVVLPVRQMATGAMGARSWATCAVSFMTENPSKMSPSMRLREPFDSSLP